MTQQQHPLAVPCSKCGWFHRRGARNRSRPGARRRSRPIKQIKNTSKSTRYDGSIVGYRLSIFQNAGSASRERGRASSARLCEALAASVPVLRLDASDRHRPRAKQRALHARELGAVLQSNEGGGCDCGISRSARAASARGSTRFLVLAVGLTGFVAGGNGRVGVMSRLKCRLKGVESVVLARRRCN